MKLLFRADPKGVVRFLVYCVFLLYLVAIAITNLHTYSTEGYFYGLNPLPAFMPEFLLTTIVFYILAVVASILSVSSFIIQREKGFGITTSKKEETGFERMADEKEVKKWFGVKHIILTDDDYEAGGVPLMLNEKEAYVNDGEDHTLIIGSTGSGKTECAMMPTVRILAKHGESMIITDPKGELFNRSSALLKQKGYKIIVLNFRDPAKGNAWNPFMLPYKFYKEGNTDKAKELLEDLASNILVDPDNKADPFWQNASRDYFAALSMCLFQDAPQEQININSINLMVTQGEEKFGRSFYDKEYLLLKGEGSDEWNSASAVVSTAADTKSGVLSTFRTKTRLFSSRDALSEMLSYSDFDFSKIGREKTAVFMTIHDEKKTYHPLLTIFVKQAYESLIDEAFKAGGKLPIRTNFLLDEFANMPALKDVDSMITASRSRNIRFTFIIQNFSQLNLVYGADMAETIKGNCNIHFLLTTELKALEEISKLCGDAKPKKAKEGEPAEPIRPLITVTDLMHMARFQFLIKRMRDHPFKSKFTPDYTLTEKNAWNCSYDPQPIKDREPKPIQTFDLREFVNKKKEEQGIPIPGSTPPGFSGGGMPIGMMANGGFNPFMGAPMGNMQGSVPPVSMNSQPQSTINFEELSKQIDAKIAELEAQEAKEKAEQEKLQVTENKQGIYLDEQLNNQNSLEEKPKINVDVDSIIVDDNVKDDDFFDDFFDEE